MTFLELLLGFLTISFSLHLSVLRTSIKGLLITFSEFFQRMGVWTYNILVEISFAAGSIIHLLLTVLRSEDQRVVVDFRLGMTIITSFPRFTSSIEISSFMLQLSGLWRLLLLMLFLSLYWIKIYCRTSCYLSLGKLIYLLTFRNRSILTDLGLISDKAILSKRTPSHLRNLMCFETVLCLLDILSPLSILLDLLLTFLCRKFAKLNAVICQDSFHKGVFVLLIERLSIGSKGNLSQGSRDILINWESSFLSLRLTLQFQSSY